MRDFIIAADLGGTNLRMAAVDRDGIILEHRKRPHPTAMTPPLLMEAVSDISSELFTALNGEARAVAVAFTAPAPVSKPFDGVLTKLPNLPGLTGMNLRDELSAFFHLSVTIENDATAAAIGESWLGASQGVDNSICVTLGTGIGGGIIINGEPIRGKDGTGGEIGHITVVPDGPQCKCGNRGCVEEFASATAIVRIARERGIDTSSAADLFSMAQNGDAAAQSVFDDAGRYLGIMLAGLVNAINPEMIVVGGGVSAGWDAFSRVLRAEIDARSYPAAAGRAQLEPAMLGDNAGLLGVTFSAISVSDNELM